MISFIIPAYNAAKYLERVVQSIIGDGKNNEEFEILIVENGSTDNTTEVGEYFSFAYPNIQVLHSPKGVSNARNYGIDHAKGEWIAFVDADDYLTKEGRTAIFEDAKSNTYDCYLYGHEAGTTPKNVTDDKNGESFCGIEEVERFRIAMLENPTKYMQVWAKLFKRELMLRHQIYFDTELRLSEDSDFTIRYSKVCQNIFVSEKMAYHYSIDNVSTMRGSSGDKIKDYILAMERTGSKLTSESDSIRQAFYTYVLMHLNIALVRDVFELSNKESFFRKLKSMKAIVQEDIFREALENVQIKNGLSLRMLPIVCLKKHLYLPGAGIYMTRAYMNKKKESV